MLSCESTIILPDADTLSSLPRETSVQSLGGGRWDLGLPQLALALQLRVNSPFPLSIIAIKREKLETLWVRDEELGIEKIPELRFGLQRGRQGEE